MDTTIVNVAPSGIGRLFSVRPIPVNAASISYLVSLAVFVPASGWLGAGSVFAVASALSSMASDLGAVVMFRVLELASGGTLAAADMGMLLRAYCRRRAGGCPGWSGGAPWSSGGAAVAWWSGLCLLSVACGAAGAYGPCAVT
jgi:hypothetical protein